MIRFHNSAPFLPEFSKWRRDIHNSMVVSGLYSRKQNVQTIKDVEMPWVSEIAFNLSIFRKVFVLGTVPKRLLRIPKYHTNVSIFSQKGTHKCIYSRIKFREAISSFWKLLSHCRKIFVKCNARNTLDYFERDIRCIFLFGVLFCNSLNALTQVV